MCGIGGILRITPPGETHQPIPDEWLDLLDEGIAWRGPDGSGRFRDTVTKPDGTIIEVALVHRRLAIIDLEGGAQPMVSARGRVRDDGTREGLVAIVFNGCIYNHRELRPELEAKGHEFVTDHSDTEVLIQSYRERGEQAATPLDGMWAFALWDRDAARLMLSRDPNGEKPLYTSDNFGRGLSFSNSVPALTRLLRTMVGHSEHLDSALVAEWTRFGFAFAGPSWDFQPLAPGVIHLHEPDRQYWSDPAVTWVLPPVVAYGPGSGKVRRPRLTTDAVDELLRRSVESRLEADVPLGCFLSGGIDSSLISHYAQARLSRDGTRLRTFCMRMPDSRYDESSHAQLVADHIGTEHRTLNVEMNAAADLVGLIQRLGLPFGDSSLLPTYWLSRAARQHVRVALTGDGGDELFCGYERYTADRWLQRWGGIFKRLPDSVLEGRGPKSRLTKLARLARAARHGGYPELVAIFQHDDLLTLIPDAAPTQSVFTFHTEGRQIDLASYLPDDLLRKTDTATMAVALEARCPFLSRELVNACSHATLAELMPDGHRKGLLRQLAARYLPPEIINRPKQGFAIPLSDWWRSDFGQLRTLMLDHLTSADPFPGLEALNINTDYVRQMIDEHMAAGSAGTPPPIAQLSKHIKHIRPRDHAQRLYMLTVLSIWARWLTGIRNSPQRTQKSPSGQR